MTTQMLIDKIRETSYQGQVRIIHIKVDMFDVFDLMSASTNFIQTGLIKVVRKAGYSYFFGYDSIEGKVYMHVFKSK